MANQLTLKPLFFEVPILEAQPLFVGRHWLLQELIQLVNGTSTGAIISGSPGTGKTALMLQLVEHSCFGRRRDQRPAVQQQQQPWDKDEIVPYERGMAASAMEASHRQTNSMVRELASHLVAYHFCQADNNSTCLVPDLIHSLAAQLCQAPQLAAYREYLLSEPHLQGSLSQRECTVDPDLALSRGILEPLSVLQKAGRLDNAPVVNIVLKK